MSMGTTGGALGRPARLFSGAGAVTPLTSRRVGAALLGAIALHALLLAARPGSLASSSYVAPPAAPAMAGRLLRPTVAGATAISTGPVSPSVPTDAGLPPAAPAEPPLPTKASVQAGGSAAPATMVGPADVPAASAEGRATAPTSPSADPKGADAALPAAPDYAFGIRLDPGPRPLEDIEPEYPDPVHLREGTVVLRLLISDTGRVDNVAVVRAEPRGVFEQAALEAFSRARFSPGLAAGTPVKSQITVEVQFVPINRGARVSGRTY
jgi:protein TonB